MVADRYEIVRPLGHGSFGRTFVARDRENDSLVALKVLDQRSDVDLKSLELFEREAAVLRSIRHQGVPEVFDLLTSPWEGRRASILVMEFVEGISLETMMGAQRQLDPAEVVLLFLGLLDVLEYLHGRVPPIVHRDIKPSNIIVRADGHASLVDFGSVRRVFRSADDGGSTIVGTYGYMPFEQYMGQASPASDLYSLAATFLHLLTGRPPRDFMTDAGRIEIPPSLPGDPRLGPIIARLLRPSPTERYASAREVRVAFLSPLALQGSTSAPAVAATSSMAIALGPIPRPLTGRTSELLEQLAPSAKQLMDAGRKPADAVGAMDLVALVLTSTITLGILPLTFVAIARQRRQRLRRFLRDGIPATAEIIQMLEVPVAFEVKLARVFYEFHVDGERHRDSDRILPAVANRWRQGDRIEILYLPDQSYDSVIIGSSF